MILTLEKIKWNGLLTCSYKRMILIIRQLWIMSSTLFYRDFNLSNLCEPSFQAICFVLIRPLSKSTYRRINRVAAELLWLELVWVVDWWAGVKVSINSFFFMLFYWYLCPLVCLIFARWSCMEFMSFTCAGYYLAICIFKWLEHLFIM